MPFTSILQIDAVVEHNIAKLHSSGQPVATVYSGPNAAKVSTEDAGGLEPMLCFAHEARVMLTVN